jgi:hypothetical protein
VTRCAIFGGGLKRAADTKRCWRPYRNETTPWIKRQQAGFKNRERQAPRQYVSGETHYVSGRRSRIGDFIERHQNDHFVKLLDRHLPQCRMYRDELNAAPLRDDTWTNTSALDGA